MIKNLGKRIKRMVRYDVEFDGLRNQADGRENNVKKVRKELWKIQHEEQQHLKDERQKIKATTIIQYCWRHVLAIKEFHKLKQEAYETSLYLLKIPGWVFLKKRGKIWFMQGPKKK